jgi:hypothetical protein
MSGDAIVLFLLSLPAIVSIAAFLVIRKERGEDDAYGVANGDCWPVNLTSHDSPNKRGGQ